MNRGRVSTQIFLCFLIMMFMMATVGCSSKDNTPAPTTYSITGTVTGSIAANVTITLSGASSATTTTASDGTYSFTGLGNGTYTLTPALTGYVFNPNPIVVVVSGSNMVQNFVATSATGTYYTISGTVMVGTTALSGVTVTMSGSHSASVVTGTDGAWSFSAMGGGANTYTLAASLSGYSITPLSITWNSPGANSPGHTFTATLAKFAQADLTGTWNVRMLKAASPGGWKHAVITLDSSGKLTYATDCLDNTGDTTCPGVGNITWIIDTSTGVITETGSDAGTNVHMTMASNKTFIAGTEDNSKLVIAQKEVTGTSYAVTDVQSKSFVFHQLMVGTDSQWEYAVGTTDATGLVTLSTHVGSSGSEPTGATNVTFSVGSDGVVTAVGDIGTFTGFLSADKKTIVGTATDGTTPTIYSLYVFNITNGQSSSLSQVVGTTLYDHILTTGTDNFWAHQSMSIASSTGVITFGSDWVDSDSESGPSGTETISISSSGAATLAGTAIQETTFNGQLSYDGKFMVATQTFDTGDYSLMVITQ